MNNLINSISNDRALINGLNLRIVSLPIRILLRAYESLSTRFNARIISASIIETASGELLGMNSTRAEIIEGLASQVLDLLASEEETSLQQIFIEQLAKIITSSSRTVWSQLRESSGVLM